MSPTYLLRSRRRPTYATARPRADDARVRRSGSPTSSRTPRPARTSSAAAAASSSRFLSPSRPGTSQAYHDNWTIGYSRHVTVGVWVGNFDRKPLRDSTGVTGAGPIFHGGHARGGAACGRRRSGGLAIRCRPPVTRTSSSARSARCPAMAANAWCPARQREWIAAGSRRAPLQLALIRRSSARWTHLADEGLLTVWPAECATGQAGARDDGATGRRDQAGSQAVRRVSRRDRRHAVQSAEAGLRIANPPDGATYLIDPTLRREFQTLALGAVASAARVRGVEGRWTSRLATASSEREVPVAARRRDATRSASTRSGRAERRRSTVVVGRTEHRQLPRSQLQLPSRGIVPCWVKVGCEFHRRHFGSWELACWELTLSPSAAPAWDPRTRRDARGPGWRRARRRQGRSPRGRTSPDRAASRRTTAPTARASARPR